MAAASDVSLWLVFRVSRVDDVTYADGIYSDSDGAAVVTSESAL